MDHSLTIGRAKDHLIRHCQSLNDCPEIQDVPSGMRFCFSYICHINSLQGGPRALLLCQGT